MTDLIKPPSGIVPVSPPTQSPVERAKTLTIGKPATAGSFHDRINKAKAEGSIGGEARDDRALTVPSRIALVLDCSGSMCGEPIVMLRQAVEAFVNQINAADTSIALEPFGNDPSYRKPLTTQKMLVLMHSQTFEATGGTPMASALRQTIESNPITRAVLVSDGAPNHGDDPTRDGDRTLDAYIESKTPIDTVAIGQDESGERVLKTIAERTGGIYLKFKDISTFVGAFKYLTPAMRGYLTSGDAKALTGADEVRK